MILIHHPIAFPPRSWNDYVALPQNCSAQTCELAAVETSNIVGKFLAHTPIPFVNAQFAFCAYVAAKALLFGYQRTRKATLRPEFRRLISNLWEMSKRWSGYDCAAEASGTPLTQAAIFANHLESLHDACKEAQFTFDLYDHSCTPARTQQYGSPVSVATPRSCLTQDEPFAIRHVRDNSVNSSLSAPSPRHLPFTANSTLEQGTSHVAADAASPRVTSSSYTTQQMMDGFTNSGQPSYSMRADQFSTLANTISRPQASNVAHNPSVQDQSLITLSDTFLDSQFLDMDRVITFEDANFFMPWQ
jgi:hypothetical protein